MARGRSAPNISFNSSDSDLDEIRAEMAKLKIQLRTMEVERQAYVLQSQDLIRRQRREMERLQAEQKELQRILCMCESRTHRQQDTAVTQDLLFLLEHKDQMDKMLESERLTLEQLNKEILNADRRLIILRRVGSTGGYTQRTKAPPTQKTTQVLENQLDRALVRFNTHLTQNSQLRNDLESLRIRRSHFQQIRQRLERELRDLREDISDVVNISTAAYNARVEVQMKMMRIKELAVKDLEHYSIEMKELETVIADERHLQDFLTIKCHSRSGQEDHRHSPQDPDEWEMREEMTDEMLGALDETFLKIHSLTGEENLDVLVRRFLEIEDQNFALFDFVNKQSNKIKELKDQVSQVQQDTERLCEDGQQWELERHALTRDLQARQQASEKRAQACNTHTATVAKILEQARTGMRRVLRRLERVRNVMKDLPPAATITDKNLVEILDTLDLKINGLLRIQAFLKSKNPDKDDTKDGSEQKAAVKSPSISEEERPLSQKELRQQMIKEILLREGIIGPRRERAVKPSRPNKAPSTQRRRPEA
ncbi:coiled-coil domain-containing protein 114 isoform X2 [Conger conger]|uniref:coiled-coil domain-containing protein 114 isoform X2 n=1 Tax=Conger conger TaxID=82655 RepID=UPI002A5AB324|nr:coiled-coil domain-containing protein 114 isoform X2 [Conger conger]